VNLSISISGRLRISVYLPVPHSVCLSAALSSNSPSCPSYPYTPVYPPVHSTVLLACLLSARLVYCLQNRLHHPLFAYLLPAGFGVQHLSICLLASLSVCKTVRLRAYRYGIVQEMDPCSYSSADILATRSVPALSVHLQPLPLVPLPALLSSCSHYLPVYPHQCLHPYFLHICPSEQRLSTMPPISLLIDSRSLCTTIACQPACSYACLWAYVSLCLHNVPAQCSLYGVRVFMHMSCNMACHPRVR
jgi:hypothetical protein